MLRQVSQHAAVGHARFHLGVEGTFEQCLADGLLQVIEPFTRAALMVTESRWCARRTSRYERSGTRSALFSTRSVG